VVRQRVTEFIGKGAALIGSMLLLTLDAHQSFATIFAATLLALKTALQYTQLGLRCTIELWMINFAFVAGGDQRRYPHINTDGLSGLWQCRSDRYLAGKVGVPPGEFGMPHV
jgi:hypothetical protein